MNLSYPLDWFRPALIDVGIPNIFGKLEKQNISNSVFAFAISFFGKISLSITYTVLKSNLVLLPKEITNGKKLVITHKVLDWINTNEKKITGFCDALENNKEIYKYYHRMYPILVKFRTLINESKPVLEARLKALETPAVEDDFFKPLSEAELWENHIEGYDYIK